MSQTNAIISNCVINLSPDKRQVFREAFRVLKPGGRLAISVRTSPTGRADNGPDWQPHNQQDMGR